jgi:hypothetical protein
MIETLVPDARKYRSMSANAREYARMLFFGAGVDVKRKTPCGIRAPQVKFLFYLIIYVTGGRNRCNLPNLVCTI